MNAAMILIPVLSAVAGWSTIRLTVWMLFHPVKPIRIGAWSLQGLLYKREVAFRQQLLFFIKTEMLAADDLADKLSSAGNLDKLRPELNDHIDAFLKVKLKQAMPMIGMLIGDRTINQLKQLFMEELEVLFPAVLKSYIGHLKQDVAFEELIKEKINAVPLTKIEQVIKENYSSALAKLSLLAALVGFVLGGVQLLIVFLTLQSKFG